MQGTPHEGVTVMRVLLVLRSRETKHPATDLKMPAGRPRKRAHSSAFPPFERVRDELAKCSRAKCSLPQYPARKSERIRVSSPLPPHGAPPHRRTQVASGVQQRHRPYYVPRGCLPRLIEPCLPTAVLGRYHRQPRAARQSFALLSSDSQTSGRLTRPSGIQPPPFRKQDSEVPFLASRSVVMNHGSRHRL